MSIDNILENYSGAGQDSLIPILQDLQAAEGYLSEGSIVRVGRHLNMPTSKIYGVATFYNQFRFEAVGKYHIQVCRGTACHVLGSASVLDALQKELKIKAGQTTRDGMFSIEVVACIGACGLAPVIAVNGTFHAGITTDSIHTIITKYREQEV